MLISVFLCGAVDMLIELTGSRVLAPYLGTSLVVWTRLIGITPRLAEPGVLVGRPCGGPAARGAPARADDYAPVDRFIMSAW
ncbi:MAG: hypothetical protein MZV70_40100 [Desulfobacterales bacterium]|nr:hypothetical protein [Desulfobacterales bacterium]